MGQQLIKLNKEKIASDQLDLKVESLRKAAHIAGLEVAIFNDNKVIYRNTFGYKNTLTNEPIKNQTNIYGASLSKAVFAVMVMSLVQKGVLYLDIPCKSTSLNLFMSILQLKSGMIITKTSNKTRPIRKPKQ